MKHLAFITGLTVLFFGALILALFFYTPTGQAVSDSIIINEIGIGQTDNSQADFAKIFNLSTNPFNLKGFRLIKRSQNADKDTTIKSWTEDTFIAPGATHIWSNNSYADTIKADSQTSQSLAKDNCLAIRQGSEDSGLIVDAVGWGACQQLAETQATCNPDTGLSLARQNHQDSDNNQSDFIDSCNPNTVVAETNTTVSAGSSGGSTVITIQNLRLNEVYPNPKTGDEWLELSCDNSNSADLTGYYIQDQSGGKAKLSGLCSRLRLVEKLSISLNNDEESLKLFSPDNQLLDSLSYSADQAPAKGQSLAKNVDGLWSLTDQPTPASDNIISLNDDVKNEDANSKKTLIINEVLPNPNGEDGIAKQQEFIELANISKESVNLYNYWLIVDNNQSYRLSSTTLAAGELLAINRASSSLRLKNDGGEIKLLGSNLKIIDRLKYPAAPEGLAWAFTNSDEPLIKDWVWTLMPSPNNTNTIALSNQAPIAILDCPSDSHWFDGSDSYDPEGQTLKIRWNFNGQTYEADSLDLPPSSQGLLTMEVSDGLLSASIDCRLSNLNVTKAKTKTSNSTSKTIKKVTTPKTTKATKTSATKKTSSTKTSSKKTVTVKEQALVIEGVAISLPGQIASQYFYLIDSQGQSWQIYQHRKNFPKFKLNQKLKVSGRLSESQAQRLIISQAADIKVLAQQQNLEIGEYRIDDLQPELEGQLAQVQGQITSKKGQLIYLDDGYGEIVVALSPEQKASAFTKGQELKATGIIRAGSSGLKLQLRQANDIELLSNTTSATSTNINLNSADNNNRYWLIATAILLIATAVALLSKKRKISSQ